MREIKLRAYHKKLKQIFPVHTLMLEEEGVFLIFPSNCEKCTTLKRAKLSEVELMLYIGLRDKNIKEVYEGDIIKADGMFDDVIIFEDGGFNLEGGDAGLNLLYQLEEYGNYEIIGNIYENPKLLRKERGM